MIGGLMEDTPLGQIVMIRKESDPDRLKNFTQAQHHIRNEWRSFRAQQKLANGGKSEDYASMFERMFAEMFG